MRITPIADLCHFGVPEWIRSLQNRDWPELFAFAERFPWIRFFTPVNEMHVAATFSARFDWWNERLHSDRDFVNALHNLAKANLLSIHSILDVTTSAVCVKMASR